jgi:AraC family transcriptional regulator of adaptative response/methylated-DNA-[protein]-cysteine methyltransferase
MVQSGQQAARWKAVIERDRASDGAFVYAVGTTGVYCRPSCPSRKPLRQNVRFYSLPELAEVDGYRPCRRCHPQLAPLADPQLDLARRLCRHIEAHFDEPLTLERLSQRFAVSPSHLQRTFKSLVGITPKAYAEACRMRSIRGALRRGDSISRALYQAGYGSSSRLYSKSDGELGMTPADYRRGGPDSRVLYTLAECVLGVLLVAATERGICAVQLGDDPAAVEAAFCSSFDAAELERDDQVLAGWVAEILAHLNGRQPHLDLPLDIRATAFQRQVWQALRDIPYGSTRSYGELARVIGQPGAARAVGRACGDNPTALLIPCHRAIRSDGGLGGYHWGLDRKRALLALEAENTLPPTS